MISLNDIEASHKEYLALSETEWRKDYFDENTGGYVATHFFKERDNLRRPGIAAEVKACYDLAGEGKHVLRLPENIPELIDTISIDGRPYRELLKFKLGEMDPRGYPDAYFDGRTWDFKKSKSQKEDTLRQMIKDGRKAENVVFIINNYDYTTLIIKAIKSEIGMRKRNGSWKELPNIYILLGNRLEAIWVK